MFAVFERDYLSQLGVTYDTAIDQELFNQILTATGRNPQGHLVTVYPQEGNPGLLPITIEGSDILVDYLQHLGDKYD